MIPIQPLVIPSTAVAQYHLGYTDRMPKAATSRGLEFSNTPPPAMTSTSAPASPPRSSSAPLDVGCVPERPDTVTPDPQAMDQLVQFESGPDIPSLIPSPPPSDLPSNYNGRILPLLPPQIICDIGESSSSEDESDSDLDEMSPEKLNAKMAKAKDKLRMVFKIKLDYWLKCYFQRFFKGTLDPSHFIFEINVGKRRIRNRKTLNLNDLIFNRF